MSKSTAALAKINAATLKSAKPCPDFPRLAHQTRRWEKKIGDARIPLDHLAASTHAGRPGRLLLTIDSVRAVSLRMHPHRFTESVAN